MKPSILQRQEQRGGKRGQRRRDSREGALLPGITLAFQCRAVCLSIRSKRNKSINDFISSAIQPCLPKAKRAGSNKQPQVPVLQELQPSLLHSSTETQYGVQLSVVHCGALKVSSLGDLTLLLALCPACWWGVGGRKCECGEADQESAGEYGIKTCISESYFTTHSLGFNR